MSEYYTIGECPFCVTKYPDGVELDECLHVVSNNSEVSEWAYYLTCLCCYTSFSVAEEEHMLELQDRLKFKREPKQPPLADQVKR